MKLFLDDIRDPPDDSWTVARSYEEAVVLVHRHGFPMEVSFDHDLGTDRTGLDFARFLVETDLDSQHRKLCSTGDADLDSQVMPDHFSYRVHSANPPGAENIEALMARYMDFRKEE